MGTYSGGIIELRRQIKALDKNQLYKRHKYNERFQQGAFDITLESSEAWTFGSYLIQDQRSCAVRDCSYRIC